MSDRSTRSQRASRLSKARRATPAAAKSKGRGATGRASGEGASRLIDERIRSLGDWRANTLAEVRRLIHEADSEIVEEWKWMGTPVWSHAGNVCTGETYKQVVKLTFARGAALQDPKALFNSSLDGNIRRAIDLREGESVDPKAFKALIRAAVAENVRHSVKNEASGRGSVRSEASGSARSTAERRSAEAELRTLIAKLAPAQLRLVGAVRRRLRKRLPTAHELVYEYRDSFVISYSPNGRGYEGVLAVRASANEVKLYFNRGKELADPAKLLQGSANQTRWIQLESGSTLARPDVVRLIDEAIARNRVPFAPSGRGSVVIRATSARKRQQRPRG